MEKASLRKQAISGRPACGVSQVMEDLAKEIKREGQELVLQEEQIREALQQLGLSIVGDRCD